MRALLLAVPRSMPLCSDLVWLDGDGEMLLVFFFGALDSIPARYVGEIDGGCGWLCY